MDKPKIIKKKAIDITPYNHGLYCTVGDNPEPFVNQIVLRKWSDKHGKIVFMLDTHNFISYDAYEDVNIVEIEPGCSPEFFKHILEKDSEDMDRGINPEFVCAQESTDIEKLFEYDKLVVTDIMES